MRPTQQWIKQVFAELDFGSPEYIDVHPARVASRLGRLVAKGVRVEEIGLSRSGRQVLWGMVLGNDSKPTITLTGNNHAEEVVGTLTILNLFEKLVEQGSPLHALLDDFRFVACPQMNPDGVMNNWPWFLEPTPKNFLRFIWRDHRGEDVEHGIAVGEMNFRRPEPRALAAFYERESAGRTVFYGTLHACKWGAGAFFLTGNEDEGVMAPAFALIRELASEINMPLRTEDLRGFRHFRRISDGIYNVPRYEEMVAGFEQVRMKGQGFLLNSLEWMERRGVAVSLVSEVPTLRPTNFTEEVLPGIDAIDLIKLMPEVLREHAEVMAGLQSRLESDLAVYIRDHGRSRWHRELFDGWEREDAQELVRDLSCTVGRPALRIHKALKESLGVACRFKRAAMMLNVLDRDTPGLEHWQRELDESFKELDSILGLEGRMTPLCQQIQLQTGLVLAGMMVVAQK